MEGSIYRIRQFESEIAKVQIYEVDYHRNLLQHLKEFYENRVVTVNEGGLDELFVWHYDTLRNLYRLRSKLFTAPIAVYLESHGMSLYEITPECLEYLESRLKTNIEKMFHGETPYNWSGGETLETFISLIATLKIRVSKGQRILFKSSF